MNDKTITFVALFASLLMIVVHLWTVVIAFTQSGVFLAFLTLAMPFAAQVYWLFVIAAADGISAPYCLAVLAAFTTWAIYLIAAVWS